MQQIPLKLAVDKQCRFDNFWPGPHQRLIQSLQDWLMPVASDWLFLQGAEGTGKSHLLQASCQALDLSGGQGMYLSFAELVDYWMAQYSPHPPEVQQDIDGEEWMSAFLSLDILFIDDIDFAQPFNAGQQAFIDECLFKLLNRALIAERPRILFASKTPVAKLAFQLADLRSRLGLVKTLNLLQLSEEQVLEWLRFKSGQLGFKFDDDSALFLLRRWPRDLHALSQALNRLNEFSLVEKRRVTVPVIKQALNL